MVNLKSQKPGVFRNRVTRFGRFQWGEDLRIRRALEDAKDRLFHPAPIRLKLGVFGGTTKDRTKVPR